MSNFLKKDAIINGIASKEQLLKHAALLKKNKKRFSPGFDGMSLDGLNSWLIINGERLSKDITRGYYQPLPAVGFRVAKMSGDYRQLAKLTAMDIVIQNSILEAITPICEKKFSDNSFAYRPSRGVNNAIERYVYLANKYRYAAKLDFVSCFDNISHEILYENLKLFIDNVNDYETIDLIMKFVKMPIEIDGEITLRDKGIIQGMPLAPILCNIYMHPADVFLTSNNVEFIRYADDIIIFNDSQEELNKIFTEISNFFQSCLNMKFNNRKCKISSPVELKYLGYQFTRDKRGVVAREKNTEVKTVYYDWNSTHPHNNRRRVDILSDGILRQKDYALYFDTESEDSYIPPESTDIINIYSNVIFDSGFLETAQNSGIIINIFDKNGELTGRFIPNSKLKSPITTHEQLTAYYNQEQRLELSKEFLLASIHNTNLVIRYYNKQKSSAVYISTLEKLQNLKQMIKEETCYEDLLMLEARVRSEYYSCYDSFIKDKSFKFVKRSRRPPKNEVNSMISFGNTVLNSLIASKMQLTALDVRVGFLHATNSRLESLNLDVGEIFKPLLVDRTIFTLINKEMIDHSHFIRCDNDGVYLNAEGKRIFLKAFYDKLDTEITVGKEKMTYDAVITEEIRKLVRHFRRRLNYTAFRQVR